MPNLYLYFSGTGNTKYATEKFAISYEENEYAIQSIENNGFDFQKGIKAADMILLAYPIYGSMIPEPMENFLKQYRESFQGKDIMTLCTQMMFSGDGGGLATYYLKGTNVNVLASMHINLPENISDITLFKLKTVEESQKTFTKADAKILKYVEMLKKGKQPKTGRRFFSRALGYLTQRLHYKAFYKKFQNLLIINHDNCTKCLKCVNSCPSGNLELIDGKIQTKGKCYICYRCVNICPSKTMKILGRNYPKKQYFKK